MQKENEKIVKDVLNVTAKVLYGGVVGAAALSVAPFDRGYTMRCVGNTMANSTSGVFSEIDRGVDSLFE